MFNKYLQNKTEICVHVQSNICVFHFRYYYCQRMRFTVPCYDIPLSAALTSIKFHCNLWTSLGNQLQVLLKWLKLFNVPCSCSCCTCYDFCLCNCNLTNLTKCLHAQLGLVPWPAFPFSFFVCQQAALDWVGTAHTCYSCVCVSEWVCGVRAPCSCRVLPLYDVN